MLPLVEPGERGRDGDGGNDWSDQAGVFGGSQADPPDRARAEDLAKTVRKAIRGSSTEFRYERQVQPQPRLGGFVPRLDGLLEANSKRPARERLTAQRLFDLLRAEGYQGGYDSVQRHARAWRRERSQQGAVFIPLWFAPGEAYQFDWSHEVVVLGGVTTAVKIAHVRLCDSRMFLIQAFPRETQEPPASATPAISWTDRPVV